LEQTKASIELVNRKIARIKAESDLTVARNRLSATWGSQAPQFLEAAGSLDRIEEIPPFDALEALIDQNPEIARWAGEMERRLAELALERAERMFDLTLSAGVKRFEASEDHAFTMGINLPLPLLNRNQGGVREARYRLKQNEYRAADAKIRTAIALITSYETLASARAEAGALKNEAVPSARLAFDAARNGYRQGKFGYLEVLDAERTFSETNARLLDALGRYHRAVAVVESLIGARLDTVVEERSNELEERQ
jgi:cobalt-zinc-cadmium efflux system outer membrane protein